MRRRSMCWLGIAVLMAAAPKAHAGIGVPVAGVDVGASIPVSTFQRVADPGGTIAPFVGYQFGRHYAFTPIIQPAFFTFVTDLEQKPGQPKQDPEDDVTSLFAILGGGRFSLFDDKKEVYFTIQGGYYTDITGPINDKGEGFMIGGGFNYEFWPGTALGMFIRRDQSSIRAARNSTNDLEFLVTGFSVRHQFLPPPPAPPPPPPPVLAAAPPPAPVEKKRIVLRGVNFDFDKANIRADAEPILDTAAATLKEDSSIAVSVEGHTDSRGTDAYNERLSVRRANAVRDYLVRHGIDASRLSVRGFGESQPVASNDTDEGRAQNRRVELRVQ